MPQEFVNAAEKSTDPFWNPRPKPDYATVSREAYHAGYSDAYHGHSFDAGDWGAFSPYRDGFNDGYTDKSMVPS